jgi:hypothetical protein
MGLVVMAENQVPESAVMPLAARVVAGMVCLVGNTVKLEWRESLVEARCRSRNFHQFPGYCRETLALYG